MPARRRELELSVERPLGPRDGGRGVVRLTERFDEEVNGTSPTSEQLRASVERLEKELDLVVGPAAPSPEAPRSDRSLAELIETYRPRQRELIDLLLEEGELTGQEHAALAASLPAPASPPAARVPSAPAIPPPPIVPAERELPQARPVPELLRVYEIVSLRQAGAVRARRQISFAEYMALKRHFEATEAGSPPSGSNERSP